MRPTEQFREVKSLDMPAIDKEVLGFWQDEDIFRASLKNRNDSPLFIFYEGPPSANGMPGIHHVLSRTIKDLFCRYKTLKGYKVDRKGGWDTHGLPVELSVEKKLGITKEDIGSRVSIAEYNAECRSEVMKYKDAWDDLTQKMGYWVDLDDPYITFDNKYIETLWFLLKRLYQQKLLYKGYTVQPYSPAAGTGLSSHELNLPGSYREVKDTSVIAQFKVKDKVDEYFLAWTTTPWTLPSNTALAVGKKIEYLLVRSFNPYTHLPVKLWIAEALFPKYFNESAGFIASGKELNFENYEPGGKQIPYEIIDRKKGRDMVGMRYEQLLPYAQPEDGDAFRVVAGDFVSTEDGTGIVHIAPSFGADDMRTAQQNGLGSLTLVDKQGRFTEEVTDFAGRYVKDYTDDTGYQSVDIDIAVKLKQENRAFKVEKYAHNYPHCWRTDKPILYYPLDSWFIKTTAKKERLQELNKEINWQPPFTGSGRFGNWLENLVDWNLSRSRYWGTPLPIWRTEDGTEEMCIGSIDELRAEVDKSVEAGFMQSNPYGAHKDYDLHRPYVDEVILISPGGQKMFREPDLIDVWFDSGAMPYAQWHWPFDEKNPALDNPASDIPFPADFIAEGVDQTRGWFFTLHALAGILFDSVAFKNVVSNGLILDKNGNKMSKRLGNAVDPFVTLNVHGADATRWYMMSNSQPWENLKFDEGGIEEVKRKFFGTLFNTYSFFALYANIDNFQFAEEEIPVSDRSELDRWIISLLHSLIKEADACYDAYEPTKAARAIQDFVIDHLSNWYVRLSRRIFWKGEYNAEKIAAFQTLYTCLDTISRLMAPIAPFFSDFIFRSLNERTEKVLAKSVHLTNFPVAVDDVINKRLERQMQLAQDISSMVLSLRKRENIKVRQPLQKIMIPVRDAELASHIRHMEVLIKSEVNVKEIQLLNEEEDIIVKKARPDYKLLGSKLGPKMKSVAKAISAFGQNDISALEQRGYTEITIDGEPLRIEAGEIEITSEDIPGWLVTSEKGLTVALDITITPALKAEGDARELVNRVQRLRKDHNYDVTDRIKVKVRTDNGLRHAIEHHKAYICSEILAGEFLLVDDLADGEDLDINDGHVRILIEKM